MKHATLNTGLLLCCLLVTAFSASHVFATDWYSNDPQLNRKQGFGDFPPANIEQHLDQQKLIMQTRPVEYEPQQYRDSNPWDGGYAPVDHTPRQAPGSASKPSIKPPAGSEAAVLRDVTPQATGYQPMPYPLPGYGGYNPGYGGPGSSNGTNFRGPWNNGGSGFSPWGGSRNGNNPFGMSGPGNWFN